MLETRNLLLNKCTMAQVVEVAHNALNKLTVRDFAEVFYAAGIVIDMDFKDRVEDEHEDGELK